MFSCFSKKKPHENKKFLFVDKSCLFLLGRVTYKWQMAIFQRVLKSRWLSLRRFGGSLAGERSIPVAERPESYFCRAGREMSRRFCLFVCWFWTQGSGIRGLATLGSVALALLSETLVHVFSVGFFMCVCHGPSPSVALAAPCASVSVAFQLSLRASQSQVRVEPAAGIYPTGGPSVFHQYFYVFFMYCNVRQQVNYIVIVCVDIFKWSLSNFY